MLVLLSCAKTMASKVSLKLPYHTIPQFQQEASSIILQMSQYSVEDIERMLRVNAKISIDNFHRYQAFYADETAKWASVFAYSGIVFKRLNPKDFSTEDLVYAQEHLLLTSFCYGLLRPLDVISSYRLEGDVVLPEFAPHTLFAFWRPRLTDLFIQQINKAGGVLCYLASDEMRGLFDWKKVEREVRVIHFDFHVWKNGKLSTIVVYTKMCRGEMTRYIIKNRITDLEQLKAFEWEGFRYNEKYSVGDRWVFTNDLSPSF